MAVTVPNICMGGTWSPDAPNDLHGCTIISMYRILQASFSCVELLCNDYYELMNIITHHHTVHYWVHSSKHLGQKQTISQLNRKHVTRILNLKKKQVSPNKPVQFILLRREMCNLCSYAKRPKCFFYLRQVYSRNSWTYLLQTISRQSRLLLLFRGIPIYLNRS